MLFHSVTDDMREVRAIKNIINWSTIISAIVGVILAIWSKKPLVMFALTGIGPTLVFLLTSTRVFSSHKYEDILLDEKV